ncbi:hypothetical protein [Massilia sp. H6]|uniref:hypothetical protein n=1 Tax=Massilia sp. H6 TaxID=2970464 RepID=UPI002168AA8A|nr:hypothetical protein [Massilia sp. H6]UVW27850.1 hypothetical protein NRS07_15035 [Massilia sp. H6]
MLDRESRSAMRKFARSHWKTILAILLAIALASLTLETDSAVPVPGSSAWVGESKPMPR